ncbi:helicase associated domain-containing protein [Streptomyces roseolus]
MHQQRKNLRAGTPKPHRKDQLDAEGMVGEPGDEAWETKLAALGSYHHAHGHLAPRQDAAWGDNDGDPLAIGQPLANLRRPGALGKDPERAATRAAQPAIDEDWNCSWPLDWQRHHRVLARLAADEPGGRLPAIALRRRPRRRRPRHLDHPPAPRLARPLRRAAHPPDRPRHHPARHRDRSHLPPRERRRGSCRRPSRGASKPLPGSPPARAPARLPRRPIECLLDDGEEHDHKLAIWHANTRQRRARLNPAQRTALGITRA